MGTEQTGTRDEAWFEALFRAHANQVAAYARRRTTDPDDVVSEVFAVAWRHRERVPDDALPWLYRTASNVVLHSRRGSARRAALVERVASVDRPDPVPADPLATVAGRLDDADTVARLFAVLPPRDVEVLRLWAWEQLAADEIAYVLTINPAAARVRLHRARKRAEALLTATAARAHTDRGPHEKTTPAREPAEERS